MQINQLALFEVIRDLAETVETCVGEIQRLGAAIHDDPKMRERYLAGVGVDTLDVESRFASIRLLRQRVDAICREIRDEKS
ncbi:MAG: hypothetical protein WA672_08610 [Candidatus Angelobacter sp.]